MYGLLLLGICGVRCCRKAARMIRQLRSQPEQAVLSWLLSRPETAIPLIVMAGWVMVIVPYLLFWVARSCISALMR